MTTITLDEFYKLMTGGDYSEALKKNKPKKVSSLSYDFRERLVIALASNPEMFLIDGKSIELGDAAAIIVESANAILKEMEK